MPHRTVDASLVESEPYSVGKTCPSCGQDHWALAQASFQRKCAKGKAVVYCASCQGANLYNAISGSIFNDCFKPARLAKLTNLELNDLLSRLLTRVWRYKNEIRFFNYVYPDDVLSIQRKQRKLTKTEAVIADIKSLPHFEDIREARKASAKSSASPRSYTAADEKARLEEIAAMAKHYAGTPTGDYFARFLKSRCTSPQSYGMIVPW